MTRPASIHVFLLTSLVTAALLTGCGQQSADTPGEAAPAETASPVALELAGGNPAAEAAVATISADYMRGIIKEISDDRYEGRCPGSAGDKLARDYLIDELEKAGLEPGAADGGWEQPFELVGVNADQPETWSFTRDDETHPDNAFPLAQSRVRQCGAGLRRLRHPGAGV